MSLRPAIVFAALISAACGFGNPLSADEVLEPALRHLRVAGPREWSSFPEQPDATRLEVTFTAGPNSTPCSLRLRQQDVKQSWHVLLNDRPLGDLRIDENDMVVYFDVPAGALRDGDNTLRIEQDFRGRQVPDDIRVGEVRLLPLPLDAALRESTVEIDVQDAETQRPLPARITITNAAGALQTVGAASNEHLAVRSGLVYTADGRARFGVPAGKYTVYAGRGFEYSLASEEINVAPGETVRRSLSIRREVPTEGYVACDTHVHTLTHSGHGDATVHERMITLAAEGIELPIAADHNVQIDHEPFAREMHVRNYFTPVIGNEVTTKIGHFNVFPVEAGARSPDHNLAEWGAILDDIYRAPGVKVAILNHARDLHGGTRPFGPKLHNAVVGENLDGWPMRFNAMEVVNSSATQTDVMQLFHDWMRLLNHGRRITPVGSSDSHDVGRHFAGQGRTYIRSDDHDPGDIDVDLAVDSFLQGRVLVSYGLIAELTVNDKYRSGDLASVPDDEVRVGLRVLAPHWIEASRMMLFANGELLRSEEFDTGALRDLPPGVKWQTEWLIPRLRHDVHLVAIAIGPGIDGPWWKTAKPYQPVSPDWEPHVIGCSGAVWLDVDGDGRPTAAFDYAQRAYAAAAGDLAKLVAGLAEHDAATSAQGAHLFHSAGGSLTSAESQAVLQASVPAVQAGFRRYLEAWRENEIARAGQ
jgi:hypothetical protein